MNRKRMIKIYNKLTSWVSICNNSTKNKKKKSSIGFTSTMIDKWDIYKVLRSNMITIKIKMILMESKINHNSWKKIKIHKRNIENRYLNK